MESGKTKSMQDYLSCADADVLGCDYDIVACTLDRWIDR